MLTTTTIPGIAEGSCLRFALAATLALRGRDRRVCGGVRICASCRPLPFAPDARSDDRGEGGSWRMCTWYCFNGQGHSNGGG